MITLSNFNETLAELMDERNLSSRALGNIVGTRDSSIRGWRAGKYKLYLSNALKLAVYFECSLQFLMGRTDNRLDFTPRECPPFYNQLLKVMEQHKKSRYRVVKDTAFSNGHFTKWKNGADPSMQSIIDLADYFRLTLDALVGRE